MLINAINTELPPPLRLQQWHTRLLIPEAENWHADRKNFDSSVLCFISALLLCPPHAHQPLRLTFSTSIGTWATGGRLAGMLTLTVGVWAALVCGYCTACCLSCSRRSCSWSCSRISCCRSRMRDDMASGGLEDPCCSDELVWGERWEMSDERTETAGMRGRRGETEVKKPKKTRTGKQRGYWEVRRGRRGQAKRRKGRGQTERRKS